MAVELAVGAGLGLAFTMLYDAVKEGMIGKFMEFKPLLGALRSTLESIQPLVIEQIGELNKKLDLPNAEIQQLEKQMWKGKNLILKLSKVHWWNPNKSGYTDQLLELDGSLKRLLNQLQMQQSRDIKMNLLVAQQTALQLAQFQERVEGLLKERTLLEEKARDFQDKFLLAMENNGKQVHELQAVIEKMMEQHQPKNAIEDSSTGGVLEELKTLLATLHRDLLMLFEENIPYKTVIKSARLLILSLYESVKKTQGLYPNEEDCPGKERLEYLRIDLQEGVKLLRQSSKLHTWNIFEKFAYTNKLMRWESSLGRYVSFYDNIAINHYHGSTFRQLKKRNEDLFILASHTC